MPRQGEGIYHRKDGLWEARYVKGVNEYGKKKYGSVYAHSYREVKEKRQDIVSRLSTIPQSVSVRKMTLNQLIEEWLYIKQGELKNSTFQKYNSFYNNHIKGGIGRYLLVHLTPVILKKYADDKLSPGLTPQTINGILSFIGNCLKYANQQYGIPQIHISYLKTRKKEMRVLSSKEQKALVQFLIKDIDIYKAGVLLALYTGIRVGELCAIQWKDIENGTLKITKTMQRLSKGRAKGTELVINEPKTYSSNRIIPIPSFVNTEIEKFRRDGDFYLMSNDKHPIIEPRVMQYHFQRYISILNLPKANFHCLRHSFATMCIEQSFDLKSLSEILGHSNVQTTLNRYVHSSMELKLNNMERLPSFL